MEEKKRLWVQTKMDPCFDKIILYKVASMAEVWADLNAPPFSFRCRSPGAQPRPGLPRRWRGSWLAVQRPD